MAHSKSSKKTAALAAAMTVAVGGFVPGAAAANAAPADAVISNSPDIVVGPGSPVRMPFPSNKIVEGRHVGSPMCSLGVAGTIIDENGNPHRVIMTAGHCVVAEDNDTGETVTGKFYIPTRDGDVLLNKGFVGTDTVPDEGYFTGAFDAVEFLNLLFNSPDYGVIEVQDNVKTTSLSQSVDEFGAVTGEPVQIVGVEDKPTLGAYEISIDNLGEPVCTDGSRTGRGCGVQLFRVRNGIWAISPIDHGDSGGNAYNPLTREAIGVNSMGVGPLTRFQPIDVALEEQYGIPDGQVNDYFKAETATEPHSQFRTIDEDSQFYDAHSDEPDSPLADLLPDEIADLIPDLPNLPDLPSPEVPHLPDFNSPALPNLPSPAVAGVNDVLSQANLPSLL